MKAPAKLDAYSDGDSALNLVDLQLETGMNRPLRLSNQRERRFLFIGGPFGRFFRQLGLALKREGAVVHHVNMQGGDWLDWGVLDSVPFKQAVDEWPAFIGDTLRRLSITDLVCYGDCDRYVRAAMQEATQLGIARHVFELGYFRPDWVTLDRNGVNGFSNLPRDPGFYRQLYVPPEDDAVSIGRMMPYHVACTIRHCIAYYLGRSFFPRYAPIWPSSPLKQAIGYMVKVVIKRGSRRRLRKLEKSLLGSDTPFFLCALQKPGDSQISMHSTFGSVVEFIDHVAASFAANAPPNTRLVFKAHPLDNGMEPQAQAMAEAAGQYGLGDRLVFLPSGSLSRLTQRSLGVVTINSTVGLSALHMKCPTVALGDAFYNIAGLTHQGGLDTFWNEPSAPDSDLFDRFRAYVLETTQINGSYYAPRGKHLAIPEACRRLMAAQPE